MEDVPVCAGAAKRFGAPPEGAGAAGVVDPSVDAGLAPKTFEAPAADFEPNTFDELDPLFAGGGAAGVVEPKLNVVVFGAAGVVLGADAAGTLGPPPKRLPPAGFDAAAPNTVLPPPPPNIFDGAEVAGVCAADAGAWFSSFF